MNRILDKLIRYILEKYKLEEQETPYCEEVEICNKKNKKRLSEEVGRDVKLGTQIRRPFIRSIVLK